MNLNQVHEVNMKFHAMNSCNENQFKKHEKKLIKNIKK